jgi:hypothetical protein
MRIFPKVEIQTTFVKIQMKKTNFKKNKLHKFVKFVFSYELKFVFFI